MTPKEDPAMADEKAPEPTTGAVVEMPWVLISNQIQLLSTQMNERFNDQRVRFDDRFAQMDKRFDDRFAQMDKRFDDRFAQMDKRFDQVDKRIDGLEARLVFRNSTWLTIVLTAIGVVLGTLLAPRF